MKGMELEWKGHGKALSTKLWEFFNEEYLVDFSVTCHGQQMKVHKFVLALMFPILKESLRSNGTIPFDQGIAIGGATLPVPEGLNLDNIVDHPEDMDYLIQFAYTGKTTVPNEHADCLLRIADSMEIKSLKESLDQWNDKSKHEVNAHDDATPLSRLRPRTQVIEVSVEVDNTDNNDDEFDFHSIIDDKSRQDSIEYSDSCSDDYNDGYKRTRKKKNNQNSESQKQSEANYSEEKVIRKVQRQNPTKTIKNLTKTTLNEQAKNGTPSKQMKNESLKCPLCDHMAAFPYLLKIHLESHARKQAKGPKQFSCKICKKLFESRKLLEVHRDSKCEKERPACKYCGHTTTRKAILLQHIMAKHQVDADGNPLEKNVKCPKCDFVCYAKHQLRTHSLAKHDLVDKYKCKECSFTAPSKTRLSKHERIKHQNRRDFMCEECGNRYQTSGALNRHVLVVHKGLKPHKCDICGAEYCSTFSFKLHRQSHDGNVEHKYVCHTCGHRSKRRDTLRLHMRKEHGIELENGNPRYGKIPVEISDLETTQSASTDT